MRVSEVVKSQAALEFSQKRPMVINNTLNKIAKDKDKSFDEVLNTYLN